MAEVVTVQKAEPVVTGITLKISVTEANDLKIFIEEYYKRKTYMPPASANKVHQAIVLGLKGKTTATQNVEKQLADMFPPAYSRASF